MVMHDAITLMLQLMITIYLNSMLWIKQKKQEWTKYSSIHLSYHRSSKGPRSFTTGNSSGCIFLYTYSMKWSLCPLSKRSQTFPNPPTFCTPTISTATRPPNITMAWNTSFHITALIPPLEKEKNREFNSSKTKYKKKLIDWC